MSKLHTASRHGISWESVADYLEENPEAVKFWAPLQMGHLLNHGHDFEARVTLPLNDALHFERTCC